MISLFMRLTGDESGTCRKLVLLNNKKDTNVGIHQICIDPNKQIRIIRIDKEEPFLERIGDLIVRYFAQKNEIFNTLAMTFQSIQAKTYILSSLFRCPSE